MTQTGKGEGGRVKRTTGGKRKPPRGKPASRKGGAGQGPFPLPASRPPKAPKGPAPPGPPRHPHKVPTPNRRGQ
jgi:hypothetical protein